MGNPFLLLSAEIDQVAAVRVKVSVRVSVRVRLRVRVRYRVLRNRGLWESNPGSDSG